MEHIIIGTAGHIDHGKTALIRALTGRETDTQKEEKKRGITIDLGFTYFDLPSGERAGIIDVPGHEKFLPNMLAGVCGMDLVLLTIALDEGIMPQTREHLDILEQLDITNGIIVLTKLDMVEEEWAQMMEEEVAEQLKGRIFETWPRICVSARTGAGMQQLTDLVVAEVHRSRHHRETAGHFRLPIDRVFSVKGLGTVVAGTVLEGTIGIEQEVMIYPEQLTAKVKSLQSHGEDITEAYAGQRTAMLLTGISKEQVHRGMVLAYPGCITPTNRLDVVMQLSDDCGRVVKNQSRVHLHIGSDEVVARVVLLDKQELHAGEKGYAQLITQTDVCVKRNDRFVVRFLSPLETLGGGKVLQVAPVKHKRFDEGVIESLRQREEDRQEQMVLKIIEASVKQPLSAKALAEQAQMQQQELLIQQERLEQEEVCLVLNGKKQSYYWSFAAEQEIWLEVTKKLEEYHKNHPYKRGMSKALFRSSLFKGWDPAVFELYLEYLTRENKLQAEKEFVWLASFEVQKDEVYRSAEKMLVEQAEAEGFALLDYEKLLSPSGEHFLQGKLSQEELEDIVENLVREEQLVRIHDTICTAPTVAAQIREKVLQYFEEQEILSFSSLRDLLEVSRKAAKPIMAYLDECKITLWCGKETERKKNTIG
ncbi:MAG: selenocysteine-specific translation elongation factor [Lachnospiraceae bacterium]